MRRAGVWSSPTFHWAFDAQFLKGIGKAHPSGDLTERTVTHQPPTAL